MVVYIVAATSPSNDQLGEFPPVPLSRPRSWYRLIFRPGGDDGVDALALSRLPAAQPIRLAPRSA